MKIVREGKAEIYVPELRDIVSADMPVFYNPRMRVNRDLAVLGLRYLARKLGRELKVADPLSASGIRSIRFIKETDFVGEVYVNDINQRAVEIIKENFSLNGIPPDRYHVHQEDANTFLKRRWGFGFDYIDLDPFGTPVPFIEACALSMKRGGILSLTATDTAPLSGTYPKTCLRRYGSRPLRNEFKHEVGVRILIKKVIELSAQHDVAMIPLFAYSHLHYFKVFFMKDRGANITTSLMENIGFLLYCFNCTNRVPLRDPLKAREFCPHCGGRFTLGGTMWLGSLWEEEFTNYICDSAQDDENIHKDTARILSLIKEESRIRSVGYYTLSKLSEKMKIPQQPPIRKAVEFYGGARTHFDGDGFRTDIDHGEVLRKSEELRGIIERRLKGGLR